MHFKGLDLNLLVALEVLMRERNTTRAGERLGLSQPAMSGALARLREYFNDPLLVPVGRQLMLTPLAQTLIEPVTDVLQRVQATIATKAQFDPVVSDRRFSIMASDYVFSVFIPDLLRRVEREAPHVTLQLRQLSPNWHDDLNRGDVDFMIIPESFRQPAHPSQPLFEDDFSCVAWKGNAAIGRQISLQQYLAHGHVVVTLSGVQEPCVDEWFLKRGGHVRRVDIVAPTFALVPLLVVGTNRLATTWTRLARLTARHQPLTILPLPITIPSFREVVQWPVHRDAEPGIAWLRTLIGETAAQMDGWQPDALPSPRQAADRRAPLSPAQAGA